MIYQAATRPPRARPFAGVCTGGHFYWCGRFAIWCKFARFASFRFGEFSGGIMFDNNRKTVLIGALAWKGN